MEVEIVEIIQKKTQIWQKKINYLYTIHRAANKKATVAFPLKSSRMVSENEGGKGVKEVFQNGW